MKKIYMEKAVASGVLFWEVIVNGSETICKAGKVGARCNEYPPNQHTTPEEANNFFKYLVEQKKKQGFGEVEGTSAKARAAPNSGSASRKAARDVGNTEIVLGNRNTKRKPLNGTKPEKPLNKKPNFKSPIRREPITKRAYSPVPIKRKESPVRKEPEDLPAKRIKSSERTPAKVRIEDKAEEKPKVPQNTRRRGRPPKQERKAIPPRRTLKSGVNTKLRKSDTKMIDHSSDNSGGKGVSPIVRARGRPRVKREEPMEAETVPPLVSKMSTTTTLCEKMTKAKIESSQTVHMTSTDSIKKWKNWRTDEPKEPATPVPAAIDKENPGESMEVGSPMVREPRRRKMTSKYEIYRQETLGIGSPEREGSDQEESEKKTPVKKASTTAAIRQNLSKAKKKKVPTATLR